MDNERKKALESLLKLEQPIDKHVAILSTFPWDADQEYAWLSIAHIANVLSRFMAGDIDTHQVEAWANAIEGRDDIGLAGEHEALLNEVLHELANPTLSHRLNTERAAQFLKSLASQSSAKQLSIMRLMAHETLLTGKWVLNNGVVRGDHVCERIHYLIANSLIEVAISPEWGIWETLFRDSNDGRYWERTYPQGEMHGGGPPELRCISSDEAKRKYHHV
jgi:hypothetical protein